LLYQLPDPVDQIREDALTSDDSTCRIVELGDAQADDIASIRRRIAVDHILDKAAGSVEFVGERKNLSYTIAPI